MSADPSRVVDLVPALMRYARQLTRDENDADDLVQEALVSAYAKSDQYQPGRPLRVWIFAILHNIFVSRIRHEAVCERFRAGAVPSDPGLPPQEHSIHLREVAEALGRLPPEQQQVLHLVAVDGMSYQDAAAVIGVPVGTLISRLSRARAFAHHRTRRTQPNPTRRASHRGELNDGKSHNHRMRSGGVYRRPTRRGGAAGGG